MARERTQMGLAIFLMAMIWGGAKAQDCTNVIISMSPCLNYIQGNSTSPSSGCCTQLASVVRSQPQCLCQVLNGGGANLGLSINQTQALELPKACNVQTPPVSQCKGKVLQIRFHSHGSFTWLAPFLTLVLLNGHCSRLSCWFSNRDSKHSWISTIRYLFVVIFPPHQEINKNRLNW